MKRMVDNLKLRIEHCVAMFKIGYRAAESRAIHCGKWESNAELEQCAYQHLITLMNEEDRAHGEMEDEQRKLTLIIPLRKDQTISEKEVEERTHPNAS